MTLSFTNFGSEGGAFGQLAGQAAPGEATDGPFEPDVAVSRWGQWGSDNYQSVYSLSLPSSFVELETFTITAWIRTATPTASNRHLGGIFDPSQPSARRAEGFKKPGSGTDFSASGGSNEDDARITVAHNAWNFFCFVSTADGTRQIWRNAVLGDTDNAGTSQIDSSASRAVVGGNFENGYRYANFDACYWGWFPRVLSASEMTDLYAATSNAAQCSKLVELGAPIAATFGPEPEFGSPFSPAWAATANQVIQGAA